MAKKTPSPPYEYTSLLRTHVPGEPYESASSFLQEYGAQGWELVSAVVAEKFLDDEHVELFYLKRPL